MIREIESQVSEEQTEPNLVRLTDGSYIQWDKQNGFYRVAFYERRAQKGTDLEMTIAQAMKKPTHNSKVKAIFKFISETDEYAAACS